MSSYKYKKYMFSCTLKNKTFHWACIVKISFSFCMVEKITYCVVSISAFNPNMKFLFMYLYNAAYLDVSSKRLHVLGELQTSDLFTVYVY